MIYSLYEKFNYNDKLEHYDTMLKMISMPTRSSYREEFKIFVEENKDFYMNNIDSIEDGSFQLSNCDAKKIYKHSRNFIWNFIENKYKVGRDKMMCPICGRHTDMELDHLIALTKRPEFCIFLSNIHPICGKCNKSKGSSDLLENFLTYMFEEITSAPYEIKIIDYVKNTILINGTNEIGVEILKLKRVESIIIAECIYYLENIKKYDSEIRLKILFKDLEKIKYEAKNHWKVNIIEQCIENEKL